MINGNVFEFRPDWQGKGLAVASVQLPLVGTELLIPDRHDGKPVTEIRRLFPKDNPETKKLIRVEIPDSVVRLDGWAFSNCENLEEVTLSNNSSLGTIDRYAFYQCKRLTKLNVPSTLTAIGDAAFSGCELLESFHFGERVILLGERAFYNCSGLKTVTFDPNCNLDYIKHYVFFGCESLLKVDFHRDMTNIYDYAFGGCHALRSVRFPEGSELYSIGNRAFAGCTELTELSIANCMNLSSIGKCAFYDSDKLKSVDFPIGKQVTLYGDAFAKGVKKINYKKQGCYIATCVYGSYDCAPVWTLRRFRDESLAQSVLGRGFIRLYYAISPTAVKWFGKAKIFSGIVKPILDCVVSRLNRAGFADTPYKDN